MTQGQLADLLGCSQPYVSQIERSSSPIIPGPSLMVQIFAATGGNVEPNDFYRLPDLSITDRQAA